MSTFKIASCFPQDITIISNAFLDEYMPKANGEFVKIYLCLLRISQHPDREISLTQIADSMSCTERDVLRAVRYWEKAGLLIVQMSDDRMIEEIAFADPARTPDPPKKKAAKPAAAPKQAPEAGAQPAARNGAEVPAAGTGNSQATGAHTDDPSGLSEALTGSGNPGTGSAAQNSGARTSATMPADSGTPTLSGGRKDTAASPALSDVRKTAPAYSLTADRMVELSAGEDFRELLFIAEQYMGRPLTKTDHEKICYFYDGLHFSADLIEYLIEYCVNLGHKSIRYIEKVGLSWYDAGIRTAREARDSVGRYHREYYDIFKALGISNHQPIAAEIRIMDKWLGTYGFAMDVITEACTRTVLRTAKPTLVYADGILTNWWKAGVRVYADIAAEDARHENGKESAKKPQRAAGRKTKTSGGSFYNFEQRNYDYQSLEARLLNMDVVSADEQE